MRHPIIFVLCAAGCLLATQACSPAPEPPSDLTGRWRVQQIAGASLGEGVRAYLDIDAEAGVASGNTGCNGFTAPVTVYDRAISFGAVTEDAAACPSEAAATDEARFLGVLGSVRRYARSGRALELLPQEYGEALLLLRLEDDAASTPVPEDTQ